MASGSSTRPGRSGPVPAALGRVPNRRAVADPAGFLPQSDQLLTLKTELQSPESMDFPDGVGRRLHRLRPRRRSDLCPDLGICRRLERFGARHSGLVTPALLLTFILASILLSPVQGPLGIANSALVLISIIIVGLAIDLAVGRGARRSRQQRGGGAGAGRGLTKLRSAVIRGARPRSQRRLAPWCRATVRRPPRSPRVELILRQHVVETERIEGKASNTDRIHGVAAPASVRASASGTCRIGRASNARWNASLHAIRSIGS